MSIRSWFIPAVFLVSFSQVQGQDGSTPFVVSKTVSIPGAELKAGAYSVRIVDRLPDRYILEVRNTKDFKVITTFLAVPDRSLPRVSAGEPIYWETRSHTPAIRGMWVEGATEGAEFVFPKAEAAALAKKVGQAVPAVDPESEGKEAVAKMDDPDRKIVGLWLLSAVAVTPNGREVGIQAVKYVPPADPAPQVASVTPSKPVTSAPAPAVANAAVRTPARTSQRAPAPEVAAAVKASPSEMPKTASHFATNLLAGLLVLSMGLLLRRRANSIR